MAREIMAEGSDSPENESPNPTPIVKEVVPEAGKSVVGATRSPELNPQVDYPSKVEGKYHVYFDPQTGQEVARIPRMEGGAEMFAGLGPFRPDQTPEQIKKIADALIIRLEDRMPNIVGAKDMSPLAEINKYQELFDTLVSAKMGSGAGEKEIEEIEKAQKMFMVRACLSGAEWTVNFGAGPKFAELVAAVIFREAFNWTWDIEGVREGVEWVEKSNGQVFRSYKKSDKEKEMIINQISEQLQKNQSLDKKQAELAAVLTYRLYIATADITRFTGPLTKDGELVEQQILNNVFKGQKIDMTNNLYWREWVNQWANPAYHFEYSGSDRSKYSQLSGNSPYLWTKLIFTPEFLASREHSAVQARQLIGAFDTHARSLSYFLKCKNLLELRDKLKDNPDTSFYGWSVIVNGTNDLVDKLLGGFINSPLISPARALDDPEKNMPDIVKSFNELAGNFNSLSYYGAAEPQKVRAFVLGQILNYVNTDEGQRVLKLRNEFTKSYNRWGRPQFYWAINETKGATGEDQAEDLMRHFNASAGTNFFVNGVWLVDGFLFKGMGKFIWQKVIKSF